MTEPTVGEVCRQAEKVAPNWLILGEWRIKHIATFDVGGMVNDDGSINPEQKHLSGGT